MQATKNNFSNQKTIYFIFYRESSTKSTSKSKEVNPPLPSSTGSTATYTGAATGYNYSAAQPAYYGNTADPNYQYNYSQWNQYGQSYGSYYGGYGYGYQ